MDFTQLQSDQPLLQDLIVVLYRYDPDADNKEAFSAEHFIAQTSDNTNDKQFVFGVWQQILEKRLLDGISVLEIWTDGGPKHFKIRSVLHFYAFMALDHSAIRVYRYNFFVENHGHSVCDGAAGQFKKRLLNVRLTGNLILKDGAAVAEIAKQVKNHSGTVARRQEDEIDDDLLSPMDGMKSYYCYHFYPLDRSLVEVWAFKYSSDAELPNAVPAKIFTIDVGLFER